MGITMTMRRLAVRPLLRHLSSNSLAPALPFTTTTTHFASPARAGTLNQAVTL